MVKFDRKKYKKYLKEREKTAPIEDLLPPSDDQVLWKPEALDTVPQPLIDRGMKGLSKYFSKNMKYPEEAFKRNVQGTVIMEFVIEKSGSITNIEAVSTVTDDGTDVTIAFEGAPGITSTITLEGIGNGTFASLQDLIDAGFDINFV